MCIALYGISCAVVFFFKQKTAYESEYGLVGSEMCIRDRDGIPLVDRGPPQRDGEMGFPDPGRPEKEDPIPIPDPAAQRQFPAVLSLIHI